MKPRFFIYCLATAAALFAALNLAILTGAKNTVPRQIARTISTTPALNCLALGNSLMQAGFNAAVFEARLARPGTVALNAGMGSSYPVEHLLFLRQALRERTGLRVVYYGFFDRQLTEPPHSRPEDLIGNRSMVYYFEPEVGAAYYRWNPLDRLTFEATRFVPALVERGAIWAKVEKLRRAMGTLGLPVEASNTFGRTADFSQLEESNPARFARECDIEAAAHTELSPPIRDMVRMSREKGARIIMVEMPMSPSHVAQYYATPAWKRYRTYLQSLLAAQGAGYVAGGEWIPDDRLFADHLHLSPAGAVAFSRRLAAEASL